MLDSTDVSLASTYKSRNAEFRQLPPEVQVSIPRFCPTEMNSKHLHRLIGSLSDTTEIPDAVPIPSTKPLLEKPQLVATIDTGVGESSRSIACLTDEEVWTCTRGQIMKLHDLQSTLLEAKQTKSGYSPQDIAVSRDGKLVYTDPRTRTVNVVMNNQIQTMITLQGWRPYNVCSTSSNDLLVTMSSDNWWQSRVVRYCGSTETQSIQFDDQGQSLLSCGVWIKYISENRNLDICVADHGLKSVVVVNQFGKLRFRYTGHPYNTQDLFFPDGIATDSQGHILTSDLHNHRIHIIDQDGQFLRYIQNCNLRDPRGVCVDIEDNLFVAESDSGKVRKIRYM